MSSFETKPIEPGEIARGVEWRQLEPRAWQWTSPDGLVLLRIKGIGMEHERTHYVYRNGKLLGHRKSVYDAMALAESGVNEVEAVRVAELAAIGEPLELPEELRATPQQQAAGRALPRPRSTARPSLLERPKTPAAKPAGPEYPDPAFAQVVAERAARGRSKIRETDVITLTYKGKNPRKDGSEGYKHYEQMRGGITVATYLDRFRSPNDKRTARQWLANTVREGHATLDGGKR